MVLWDRLFLDSVQGKDVRLRMVLETRATYETAKRWLEREEPVRLKAVAAGTGLSMILAYDRLVRDGYNPDLITATITDREEANIDKANRLLGKLGHDQGKKAQSWKGIRHLGRRLKTFLRGTGRTARLTQHRMMLSPPSASWSISKGFRMAQPSNGSRSSRRLSR